MMIRPSRGVRGWGRGPVPRPLAISLLLPFTTRGPTSRSPLTTPPFRDMFAPPSTPTSPHLGAPSWVGVTHHGTHEILADRQGARRPSPARDARAALDVGRADLRRGGGTHPGRAVHRFPSSANPGGFRARIDAPVWTACALPSTARKPRGLPGDAPPPAPPSRNAGIDPTGAGDRVVTAAVARLERNRAATPLPLYRAWFGSHIDGRRCIDRTAETSLPRTLPTCPRRPPPVRTLRAGVKSAPHPGCRSVATLPLPLQ